MAIDRLYLLSRTEEIEFEEQRSIRREVDAEFFKQGWRGSPSLVAGSARVIAIGVRRTTARIAEETWTIAEKEAPRFAADARKVAKHMRTRMVDFYRQRLMSDDGQLTPEDIMRACQELSEVLHNICNEMVDDLIYRSKPLPSSSLPERPDLDPFGPAETPRKIVRQAQCIDLDKLSTMLSEVRSLIGAARIDNTRRRALIHQICRDRSLRGAAKSAPGDVIEHDEAPAARIEDGPAGHGREPGRELHRAARDCPRR